MRKLKNYPLSSVPNESQTIREFVGADSAKEPVPAKDTFPAQKIN